MRAIPKRLLIHRAKVYGEEGGDWSGGEPKLLGVLEHVRAEPESRVVRDKNNRELKLSAVLFFDCKNSRSTAGEPKEDMLLELLGERFRVVSVEPFFDESGIHHYELGLARYAG